MVRRPKSNGFVSLILIVFLLGAIFLVKQCRQSDDSPTPSTNNTTTKSRGLDRNPAAILYSKHARCRMDCRHISETEVKQILKEGKINYGKSDLGDNPECKRRYAVEGNTKDGQKVRIIFAPCQSEVTVVTVIDLGKEWACNCD